MRIKEIWKGARTEMSTCQRWVRGWLPKRRVQKRAWSKTHHHHARLPIPPARPSQAISHQNCGVRQWPYLFCFLSFAANSEIEGKQNGLMWVCSWDVGSGPSPVPVRTLLRSLSPSKALFPHICSVYLLNSYFQSQGPDSILSAYKYQVI